ncbi:MAG: NAD(P)/FAD-dependent oxidoreductase [Alphaproteobacteria bacterium]
MRECDILIVGAGIAGTSAAYHLVAKNKKIIILERESQPGYHTTGRSAAVYTENYGPRLMRVMSVVSGPFLRNPPKGHSEVPLMHPRAAMFIARPDQTATLEGAVKELQELSKTLLPITAKEAYAKCPALKPGYVAAAAYDSGTMDMDVNAIHQGYIRGSRKGGAEIICDAEVTGLARKAGKWRVTTAKSGDYIADIVVNAAGAWADVLGTMAGVRGIGLQPKRRTVIVFDAPAGTDIQPWPIVADIDEKFYFKPEAGRILASPADETPVPPQDIQPEDEDKALIAERIEACSILKVGRIQRSWAGLRSFVKDKHPVVGFAPDAEGFFWLAGQGGYGIQTSFAMGMTACSLLTGGGVPDAVKAFKVSEEDLGPARLW